MTSGFSVKRPALVPRHAIPCQCETCGINSHARASAWGLVIGQFQGRELVAGHNVQCRSQILNLDISYQRAPVREIISSRFSDDKPTLVPGHNIQCRSEILSLDICFQRGPGDNHDQQVLGRKTGAGTES